MEVERMTVMTETLKFQPIYLPGDQADKIYLLKKGKVKISRISEEGKLLTLAILGPGDFFGEMALLDSEIPNENYRDEIAEAIEDTYLCMIDKASFEMILQSKPKLNLKVTKLIGFRLRTIENQMENLLFRDSVGRLEFLLVKLAKDFGIPHPEGVLIDIKLSHQDLGNLINSTRQTVSETITRFKQEGKIKVLGKKILLLPGHFDHQL